MNDSNEEVERSELEKQKLNSFVVLVHPIFDSKRHTFDEKVASLEKANSPGKL